MSIASYTEWKRELHERVTLLGATGTDRIPHEYKTGIGPTGGKLVSMWALAGRGTGATPTSSGSPARTLAGTLNQPAVVDKQYIAGINVVQGIVTGLARLMFYDILVHSGGLSGIVTTAQTTNLPSAALPRNTSGEGVMAALQIYTIIGTTATTVTVSYTNQAGTAGRTSKASVFGGTGNREVGVMIPIMLQDGDTGIRSVESVTVLATTGTAGNFGVVLFRPKSVFVLPGLPSPMLLDVVFGGGGMQMEEITGNPAIGMTHSAATSSQLISFTPIILDTP